MATFAQSVQESPKPLTSYCAFLKEELIPYPGRAALVGRMVLAATLAMLITMTFRLPYGAYCAIYAVAISRESTQITLKTAVTRIASYSLGAIYVLIGATFFVDDPPLRLLWVIGTMFLTFYAMSAMSTFVSAVDIGYLIVLTVPLWDEHISGEQRLEATLWAVFALTISCAIAVVVELFFEATRPGNDLLRSIADRLTSVEAALVCYGTGGAVDQATADKLSRLAMLGTSRLRRTLLTSNYPRDYMEQIGAVVALVGRLVDIAASLTHIGIQIGGDDRQRMRALAASIGSIRAELLSGKAPGAIELKDASEPSGGGVLLLREMEKTVLLIPAVFSGAGSTSELGISPSDDKRTSTLLVPDAFSNLDHVKFGLKGGLAASLCYITYNALAWPGISTAVTTCLLTALSTVGFSRQKQVLRFAGAIVGGFLFGMGAQIVILPYLDSIAGFTVLFIAVSAVGAWFATSSPRLAYFGVQILVAFYLINLQEFREQISLGVARDRVVGILLGLCAMWFVFDQLWGTLASVEIKKVFISNLRWLAEFERQPLSKGGRSAIECSYFLRETINSNFDKVTSLADGLLFEFGPTRQQDLMLRKQIREWQPQLRMLFLTRVTLFKYRLQLTGFELPKRVRASQLEFDGRLAVLLDRMADRMEEEAPPDDHGIEDALERLEKVVRTCCSEYPQQSIAIDLKTFLALSRTAESLVRSLQSQISFPNIGSSAN
ncbi:FUSC family protein [Edaphobacter aggregans]|uniref:FUSC family protein n=1 Tax=Edaphobacter aggregans TaxID=570835 RepID=UPI0005512CB1|nr:FUSC family protein [Edaphobacter aggregans]